MSLFLPNLQKLSILFFFLPLTHLQNGHKVLKFSNKISLLHVYFWLKALILNYHFMSGVAKARLTFHVPDLFSYAVSQKILLSAKGIHAISSSMPAVYTPSPHSQSRLVYFLFTKITKLLLGHECKYIGNTQGILLCHQSPYGSCPSVSTFVSCLCYMSILAVVPYIGFLRLL